VSPRPSLVFDKGFRLPWYVWGFVAATLALVLGTALLHEQIRSAGQGVMLLVACFSGISAGAAYASWDRTVTHYQDRPPERVWLAFMTIVCAGIVGVCTYYIALWPTDS
jgi:hypothetical protein